MSNNLSRTLLQRTLFSVTACVLTLVLVPAPATAQLTTPLPVVQPVPAGPTVIPAIAPVRVLPLDPPLKDGLVPAFKAGAVRITPYGFIKATAVNDTSSPNGDDF